MALSDDAVNAVLQRFRWYPNFPAGDTEAVRSLSRACRDAFDTDEELREGADELERTVHFCPLPVDFHEVAEKIRERKRAAPPLRKDFDLHPVDRLLGQQEFYEILTDERIEHARAWTQSNRKELRLIGEQILRGVAARRASMSDAQWAAERRKAHFDAIHAEEAQEKRGRHQ